MIIKRIIFKVDNQEVAKEFVVCKGGQLKPIKVYGWLQEKPKNIISEKEVCLNELTGEFE